MTPAAPDPIPILEELVRIPSHDGEAAAADYLASRLVGLQGERGARVRVHDITGADGRPLPGRRNVAATWGTGPRSLILNSHLDTVPPTDAWSSDPLVPIRRGDLLRGLGSADAKGSLAAMVATFEHVARSLEPSSGRLILLAAGMEEAAGLGSERAVGAGLRADAVIVGEPTEMEVCVAHKGVLRLEISTVGRAAHASEPWEGQNAISAMLPVVAALEDLAADIARRSEEPVGNASMAVTTIRGGSAQNVVPARCTVDVDRRLLPSENPRHVREEIESAVRRAARGEIHIVQTVLAEAAATPADTDIARLAIRSSAGETRAPAKSTGFAACCDMRFFRNRGAMPCVILGPGSLSQAHRADEYVSIAAVRRAASVYEEITRSWFAGAMPA